MSLILASAGLCVAQPDLDRVVENARKEFDVPGIAVAIVKDGHVVLLKGYGVRKLGDPAPVTPQSLFRIASNTKAFTVASLAMLVDEGKIRWDDRVIDHMPGFQMYDPYVTRELMIRDLLCHRSGLGLGAGDLMFWPSTDLTRDQIVSRIRFLKPASSFRSRYAYDNLLYLVAGQMIPLITGKSWDDFVKERIFTPLGMDSTNVSTSALLAAHDVTSPHARGNDKLVPIAQADHDNNAPAGSMNSSVADLAKWLVVQLNQGELPDGRRLFSAAQSKEMWTPQTILPVEDLPAGAPTALQAMQPNFAAYGLGWMLRDYRGKKLVFHTGTLAGYVSRITMLPELKLGIAVLTNQEEAGAHTAITWTILDHYLGAPATDWVTAYHDLAKVQAAQAAEEEKKAAGKRNASSHPSLALASYAGRYRDAWYGDVVIEEHAGKLSIAFTHTRQLAGELEHWQYDTFVAHWKERTLNADAFLTFQLGADGSIEAVKMTPVSPLTDFSYDFQDLALRPVVDGASRPH
ncbi:MAG TPA: serine hydrolase [Bryobacteraceae bacterium]|nr:serine hydrolase [Bryobacteraceae bacterium]